MKYVEAINYINDKNKFGSRLGLDVIGKLLDLLGNPHLGIKYIHVGGTNGKGSTSSYIANTLKEVGYKVGLFTSPYLERFNERISVNGEDIPDEKLGEITARIKEKIEIMLKEGYEHPTTFEIVTTIAFVYFKEVNVDCAVLEVGLGGRSDSTNVIKDSLVSVITPIDFDHVEVLGDSLGKIAYEKAGIIKEKGMVISYPQDSEALDVLKQIAREKNADFILCPMENIKIKKLDEEGGVFDFKYKGKLIDNIEIKQLGEYQIYNSTLALFTLLTLKDRGLVELEEDHIRRGFKNTLWRGRLELLQRKPRFLIDGAHNLQGVRSLVKSLELFNYKRLILGVGILGDKDVEHMVEELAPIADEIVVTEVNMPRKLEAEILEEMINKYNKNTLVEKNLEKAVEIAFNKAQDEDLIIFAGSLYLIGDVRKIVRNKS